MSKSKLTITESPIRQARRSLHLTIEQAADKADIHWQAWYLAECGCYESTPPKISHFLSRYDITITNGEIDEFIRAQRYRCREQIEKNTRLPLESIKLPPVNTKFNPFFEFRAGLIFSRTHFAKSACVQPASLYKLETNKTGTISEQIQTALKDIGFAVEFIEELQERQEEYYNAR